MRKTAAILALTLLLALAARGDTLPAQASIVSIASNDVREIVRIGPGACLRGPLIVKDTDGRTLFQIGPGVHYPAGCEAQR